MLTVYGKKFGLIPYRITVETPRGAPSNMLILDALHLHAGHRGLGGLRLLLQIDHHADDDREGRDAANGAAHGGSDVGARVFCLLGGATKLKARVVFRS